LIYETVKAKSLLSKRIQADSWFHINRSFNSYRGCEFACSYCDGLSEYYHVDNFQTHIKIKENAPAVLRKELEKEGYIARSKLETESLWAFIDDDDAKQLAWKTPRRQVIGVCGGVSDGYQQAEEKYKITRQNLEVLQDFGMPVFVLTKSNLVIRDLEILKGIHKDAFANIVFTITLHDMETKKAFEPKSSSIEERFEALNEIRAAGLFGGVMSTPIIPGIGDTYENMRGLAKEAKKSGAEFILFAGMTMKPGRQKEHFLHVVKKRFPDKFEYIREIYAKNNKYGHADYTKIPVRSMLRGYEVCREVGISDRSVRHNLPFEHDVNTKVLGVILDIVYYQSYLLHLPPEKSKPYHELAIRIEHGVENLNELSDKGELYTRLLINGEIADTVDQIVESGTCERIRDIHDQIHATIERFQE